MIVGYLGHRLVGIVLWVLFATVVFAACAPKRTSSAVAKFTMRVEPGAFEATNVCIDIVQAEKQATPGASGAQALRRAQRPAKAFSAAAPAPTEKPNPNPNRHEIKRPSPAHPAGFDESGNRLLPNDVPHGLDRHHPGAPDLKKDPAGASNIFEISGRVVAVSSERGWFTRIREWFAGRRASDARIFADYGYLVESGYDRDGKGWIEVDGDLAEALTNRVVVGDAIFFSGKQSASSETSGTICVPGGGEGSFEVKGYPVYSPVWAKVDKVPAWKRPGEAIPAGIEPPGSNF